MPTRRPQRSEEGYVLLAVICMLALLIIALSVAVPKVRESIQRDREIETMNRGKQYIRAIQLYYRKFGAYPPSIDALVKSNDIRFLRKRYIDPITGKDDWKPILFGQAKTQTLGFFGQPLQGAGSAGGSVMAGTGPSGGNSLMGSSAFGSSGSAFGSASSSPAGGTSILGSSGTGSTTGASGTTGSGDNTSSGTSSTGLSGQTFGGAGIIGVSPVSPKPSILIFKKKQHYNEWEFIYDPLTDKSTVNGNAGTIGQPAGSANPATTSTDSTTSTSPTTNSPATPPSTPTQP